MVVKSGYSNNLLTTSHYPSTLFGSNSHQIRISPEKSEFDAKGVIKGCNPWGGYPTLGLPFRILFLHNVGLTLNRPKRYSAKARQAPRPPPADGRGKTIGGAPKTFRGVGRPDSLPHERLGVCARPSLHSPAPNGVRSPLASRLRTRDAVTGRPRANCPFAAVIAGWRGPTYATG